MRQRLPPRPGQPVPLHLAHSDSGSAGHRESKVFFVQLGISNFRPGLDQQPQARRMPICVGGSRRSSRIAGARREPLHLRPGCPHAEGSTGIEQEEAYVVVAGAGPAKLDDVIA